jgi:hypothetical protein
LPTLIFIIKDKAYPSGALYGALKPCEAIIEFVPCILSNKLLLFPLAKKKIFLAKSNVCEILWSLPNRSTLK